jgi:hypothetical protein
MGNIASRCGFQAKMRRMWASDNDSQKKCGKKHKRIEEKSLKPSKKYVNINTRDI